MKRNWIDNKTVVISGASSGMGKGIAISLIKKHGCKVIGIGRSEEKMKKLKEELGEYSSQFDYRLFDVSSRDNWIHFAVELKRSKQEVDVLINNAGMLPKFDKFSNYSDDEIEMVMKTNFFSAVYAMHAMLPILMKSKKPAIINVSSSASLMSIAGTSAYSASKAALRALTEAMREELRGKCYVGIICPGFTKTDIFRNQSSFDSRSRNLIDKIITDCDVMVDNIMEDIKKKKALAVHGFDAKAMNYGNKLAPVLGSRIFSLVLKYAKTPLFEDVFKK